MKVGHLCEFADSNPVGGRRDQCVKLVVADLCRDRQTFGSTN